MEPYTVVVAFASVASAIALVRIVTEYRQSNRELHRVSLRRNVAVDRFRRAADTLRRY
jgi:hypothetical protein